MEQHHLFILFVIGYAAHTLSVPRKYYLIQQGKTWNDAQAYCQATHTDLAIIETNDNMVQLQNEAHRQGFSSSAWIGLYNDFNSWRWSLGNESLGSLQNWAAGEPNNADGNQECVMITKGGWSDRECTEEYPFVCFDDSKNGNDSYIYISEMMTWLGAQSYCRQYHTDLVSTRNETEYSVIVGLISGWTWIGLFRDSWKWTDQTNFSIISWMSGKPDNALGTENCGYVNNSQAADAQCSDIMPFFCYSAINGKQQIVRVKVWSNQGTNQTAEKATILEQVGLIIYETPIIMYISLLITAARSQSLHQALTPRQYQTGTEGPWDGRKHHSEMERAARLIGVSQV